MTHDWDNFGNEPSSVGGAESDSFYGGPGGEEYASEQEWLGEVMDEVADELQDIAALRRTSEQMVEGEVSADLWLTLDFQLSTLPGPGGAGAVMSCTVEGNGESRTGQVEFEMEDPLTFIREEARDGIVETIELHPSGGE